MKRVSTLKISKFVIVLLFMVSIPCLSTTLDKSCLKFNVTFPKNAPTPVEVLEFKFKDQNCQNSAIPPFTLKKGQTSDTFKMEVKQCGSYLNSEDSTLRFKIIAEGREIGNFQIFAKVYCWYIATKFGYLCGFDQEKGTVSAPADQIITVNAYKEERSCHQ
jgi:hypothetical protein